MQNIEQFKLEEYSSDGIDSIMVANCAWIKQSQGPVNNNDIGC